MLDGNLQREVVRAVVELKKSGRQVVMVHGGGPFIADELERAGIISEFVDGHRMTPPEAMPHVEVALKGRVNGRLVSLFNMEQSPALGMSGKDAMTVVVAPRLHERVLEDGRTERLSLGRVGDVKRVNAEFLIDLLDRNITPVIACVAVGEDGEDYNVNADMMAGHIAGALRADHYLVLTDVDGLLRDVGDPQSRIRQLNIREAEALFGRSIKGGMIPKIESCIVALRKGAHEAGIINGTRPHLLLEKLIQGQHVGTTLSAHD